MGLEIFEGRFEKITYHNSPMSDYVDVMFNGHELSINSKLSVEKQSELIEEVLKYENVPICLVLIKGERKLVM